MAPTKQGIKLNLEEERERRAEARAKIGIRSTPITAIRLSLQWLVEFVVRSVVKVLKSPFTWLVVVPGIAAWAALKYHFAPELFVPPVCGENEGGILWRAELIVTEVAWWVILGILSSVGFGTGLHSGLMFLFPHVMQVVGAAEACHTTEGLVAWYQHPCKLDCHTTSGPKDGSTVTVFRLWMMVTIQCMLWGIGTAVGELPPYLVSRAARLGGSKDSEFEAELAEAREKKDLFSRMKMWTIDFTERHGFVGVLLLASWPNAAFDMCGMCCGYVLMPFWTFFIATTIGKGMIKVNLQAVVFVVVFGSSAFHVLLHGLEQLDHSIVSVSGRHLGMKAFAEKMRAKLIAKFELQSRFFHEKLFGGKSHLELDHLKEAYRKHDDGHEVAARVMKEWDTNGDGKLHVEELAAAASRTDGKVSLSSLDPGTGTSPLKVIWELFIVGLVLFFLFSVVDQIARTKQGEIDEEELSRLEKEEEKKKSK
jgi:membrane protein YqaA with SNARE-associated domain